MDKNFKQIKKKCYFILLTPLISCGGSPLLTSLLRETCTLEGYKRVGLASEVVKYCLCVCTYARARLKETLMKRFLSVGKHAERKQAAGCLTLKTPAPWEGPASSVSNYMC